VLPSEGEADEMPAQGELCSARVESCSALDQANGTTLRRQSAL
jgi:hypothetical protein|tara:strand:- start:644 stop:772 length:129 start_codon:yes stop_codon:yes gene_type:complete